MTNAIFKTLIKTFPEERIDDFNDDTGAIIDWEDLSDDCKNYVYSVPVA